MKKILSTMLVFSFLMLPISGCSETNEPVSSLPESDSAGDFAPISDGQPSETVETEPEEEAEEPVMDEEAYKATCQAYGLPGNCTVPVPICRQGCLLLRGGLPGPGRRGGGGTRST